MKRFISVLLVLTMVFGMSTSVFAGEAIVGYQTRAEFEAKIVEKVTGIDKIDRSIVEKGKCFFINTDGLDISIPKKGNAAISIAGEECGIIKTRMPAEVSNAKGVMTKNGTIVFDSNEDSMSVSVQVLNESQNGIQFSAFQNIVTLKNEYAPKSFSYCYELPEGYRLLKDYEYGLDGEDSKGFIYVVNCDNEIVDVIEAVQAVDAKGKNVDVDCNVDDSVLTIGINADADTEYPIVVPLVDHASFAAL